MTYPTKCGVAALAICLAHLVATGAGVAQERGPSVLLPLDPLWTTTLPAAATASPVHEAGRLFVPLRNGQIAAVNLGDGQFAWNLDRSATGPPAVGNGRLFVASASGLAALDTATGLSLWSIPIDAPASGPLVWKGGWLIAPLDSGVLLALRADTGDIIWRQELGAEIEVAPALAGDRIYVSMSNGDLVALSLMTGESVWAQTLPGAPQEVLPLDDLFVGATDNHFYRVSRRDGSIKWRWRAGGDVVGRPAADEQRVYFSSLDNIVWGLDRSSGVQQWRQPLDVRPTAGPILVEDLLAFGGLSQYINFFHPIDGVSYGRVGIPSELAYPPLHLTDSNGEPSLVLVTGEGQLHAFGPASAPPLLDLAVAPLLGEESPADLGTSDTDNPALDAPATEVPRDTRGASTVTPALASADAPGGEYAIQVGAFATRAAAVGVAQRLAALDFPSYIIDPGAGAAPALYRVRVGNYADRETAEAVGQRVEDEEQLAWFLVPLR